MAISELITKVCDDINKISRQIGISLIFLADSKKYIAPKNALPASKSAGMTLGYGLPRRAALGSMIMKRQPTNASITPMDSFWCGLVPIATPIRTM